MSVSIKTNNYGEAEGSGFIGANTGIVHVGIYEIPLEEFCTFTLYILKGGTLGWNGKMPECVQKTILEIQKRHS
jgi:hypothetical protein